MAKPAPNPPPEHRTPRIKSPSIQHRRNGQPYHVKCGGPVEQCYGLAGGGCGVYIYCPKCEEVVVKFQAPEMK
jgi:hypothetical protein